MSTNKFGIKYNPVVTNGTFIANNVKVKAVEKADARFKIAKKLGIAYGSQAYFDLDVMTIIPTVRQFD